MYEIFEKLCKMRGITPYRFCEDTGVGTSTISTWKRNNSQCRPKLAKIVCEYFGISHDYLMTGNEKEKPDIPIFEPEHLELIELYSKLKEEQKIAIMNLLRSFNA